MDRVSKDFPYRPLKSGQIRLMILYPGPNSQPLRCCLLEVHLEDFEHKPPDKTQPKISGAYEALSYAWGEKTCQQDLVCHSGDSLATDTPDGVIRISANLAAFLRRYRSTGECKTLWIDAICINQLWPEEKSEQVLLMTEIYRGASRTLIWLGEEGLTTMRAIHILKELISDYEEGYYWDIEACSGQFAEDWRSFEDLLCSPWFSRVWVVQEALMSRDPVFFVGRYYIAWEDMRKAAAIIEGYKLKIKSLNAQPVHKLILWMGDTRVFLHYWQHKKKPGVNPPSNFADAVEMGGFGLEELLKLTRACKATEPRDYVYALLGITTSYDRGSLVPDYSMSLRDLYIKAAQTIFEKKFTFPLKFLSYVQHQSLTGRPDTSLTPGDILPSWVPDWRNSPVSQKLTLDLPSRVGTDVPACIKFPPNRNYGAALQTCTSSKTQYHMHDHAFNCLRVRGRSFLKIMRLADDTEPRRSNSILEIFNTFPNPYPTTSLTYAEVSRNICNPELKKLHSAHPRTQNFWDYVQLCETKRSCTNPLPLHLRYSAQDLNLTSISFMDEPDSYASGRTLFASTIGFMGLVPRCSSVGDEICVLFGGSVPYVIRRHGAHCLFVGECYVYGLMGREVAKRLDEGDFEDFSFI
jgi:hypothetical protein